MSQRAAQLGPASPGWQVIAGELEGTTCEWCGDGELVRGTYKDNPALVCTNCQAPATQFFDPDA